MSGRPDSAGSAPIEAAVDRRAENRALTSLRGLAAIWVVLHHLDKFWHFPIPPPWQNALVLGGTAVDVFFILSGFILTTVHSDLRYSGIGFFFIRRICRIYPLHLVIMSLLGAFAAFAELQSPDSLATLWPTFWSVTALTSALVGGGMTWNPPTWSASVELGCYLIFPFCIAVLRVVPTRARAMLMLSAFAAEFLVLLLHWNSTEGAAALLRGASGFTLGMTISGWWAATRPVISDGQRSAVLFTFVAALVANRPEAVALAAAAMIACLADDEGRYARALRGHLLVWIGRISFSIYLLHFPLLLFFKVPKAEGKNVPVGNLWLTTVAFLAVLLTLSSWTYLRIENPARTILPQRFRGLGKALTSGAGRR